VNAPTMASTLTNVAALAIALAATVALALFIAFQVEASLCREQGGRIIKYGLDHICTRPDGSTVAIEVLPSGVGARSAISSIAVATAGAIYLGLRRLVMPGRRAPAAISNRSDR
jgi:hypothetical protein